MTDRGADVDEDATVTVAPREIHDYTYRAGRVAGCDPGTADRIAENVTFAEIQHGAAVRAFCEALEAVDLPTSAWATAPDALVTAEIAARTDGAASASFDPPVPMAAIAATLQQCFERGIAAAGIDGRVRSDSTVGLIEMRRVDGEAAAASLARVADARDSAHRLGVEVGRSWFSRLEAAAAGFLVSEATLDGVC